MKYLIGFVVGVAVIIGVPAMWYIGTYNSLVSGDQTVQRTAAQVQTSYQRRADLIPNLVKTVEGYAQFERGTLTDVINARSKVAQLNVNAADLANDPDKQKQFADAQAQLSGSLSRLMVVVEKYPDLRSDRQFINLQRELAGTENRINVARNDNQQAVEAQNTRVYSFLSGIVASRNGFKEKPYYKAEEKAQTAPQVNFGGKS